MWVHDSLQTDLNWGFYAHLCNAFPKSGKEIEKTHHSERKQKSDSAFGILSSDRKQINGNKFENSNGRTAANTLSSLELLLKLW